MEDNPSSRWQDILFKPGETIAYKQDVITPVSGFANLETQFYIVNPVRDLYCKQPGSLANIASLRNIVVEFDEGTVSAQRKLVDSARLPFAIATHSGNKSVHFIVAVSDGFTSLDEYGFFVSAVYRVLGGAPDPKCRNANRLTRLPFGIRADTGKRQELLEMRASVTKTGLHYWLANEPAVRAKFSRFQKDLLDEEQARRVHAAKISEQGPTPLPRIYRAMIEDGAGHPDALSRHDSLVKLGAWLTHNGYNEDQLEEYLFKAADALGIGDRSDASSIVTYFRGARR